MRNSPNGEVQKLLVFGGTGTIGSALVEAAHTRAWNVVATTRRIARDINASSNEGLSWVSLDPFDPNESFSILRSHAPFDAVCWAQGANVNDSVYTVDPSENLELYRANCVYILITLKALLDLDLLTRPARLCVLSSIWQNLARQNKLSYGMTKSALQGLVLSAAADLADDGHLINAVLPGALDTPMTRRNLSPGQIDSLRSATKFRRLATLEDVISVVFYLCSRENTGLTGQFISADLGFTNVRLL
jgi:3-oxoacyl-[acyl-carrier protein] reductase